MGRFRHYYCSTGEKLWPFFSAIAASYCMMTPHGALLHSPVAWTQCGCNLSALTSSLLDPALTADGGSSSSANGRPVFKKPPPRSHLVSLSLSPTYVCVMVLRVSPDTTLHYNDRHQANRLCVGLRVHTGICRRHSFPATC